MPAVFVSLAGAVESGDAMTVTHEPKPYDDALVDDLAKIFGPKVGTILVRAALDRLVELGGDA